MRRRNRARRSPAMAESEIAEDKEMWNTGEELLLACAVKRHGVNNWDSVAMEVQARTSHPLTPQNCEQKYADLKRRFMDPACRGGGGETDSGDRTCFDIPWLDELRELRVAELRREVHRYDVSILSLQFKVKKLKDDRELSSKEEENKEEKSDLEKDPQEERLDGGEKNGAGGSPELLNQEAADKSLSGEENRSCNESNSTGAKREDPNAGSEDAGDEPELVETGSGEPDPESFKGSTDTKRAESGGGQLGDAAAAESKGEEDGTKESSDVQSSASLTRRRRRREKRGVAAVCSSGEEPEADGRSPEAMMTRDSVESEPLVSLLQFIRSHEHSSLFEHPLQSQDYKSIVKQHVDLRTIETRLRQGSYSSSTSKFSRDLLLLLTNFTVFFPKSSPESIAARELRQLVSHYELEKQMPVSSGTPLPPPKPSNPERPDSLLAKHKSSAPIIVCRKRSSLSVAKKAELQSDGKKPALDAKPSARPSRRLTSVDEKEREMMATTTGVRSSRRSTKNQANAATSPVKKQSASPPERAPKSEKRKNVAGASAGSSRKRGAAVDFLERIKLNSSRSSGGKSDLSAGKEDQKARGRRNGGNTQGDKKLDGGSSMLRSGGDGKGGGGKQMKEEESPSKRNTRRPLKKVADLTSKRKRPGEGEDTNDKETVVASNRRRKRVRR